MGNPIQNIEDHVEEMLRDDINPTLWKLGCAAELQGIEPNGTSYLVTLSFSSDDDEIPEEAYEHMRELEWFLRDELTMPGLLVEPEMGD